MAGEVRARMIEGAAALLATSGVAGTSFSEVLHRTGAPRGSIYHHFPGGKDELVSAAMAETLRRVLDLIDTGSTAPAVDVAEAFLAAWRRLLTDTDFVAGCALVAVTVGAESAELRRQAGEAFRAWQAQLADALERGGLPPPAAERHATLLLAASEGAVVMSRATSDLGAFESVAASLLDGIRRDLDAGDAGSGS
jgi:TetR/AcrR family transcriptional repressor of lmrAB and yxaGH operons